MNAKADAPLTIALCSCDGSMQLDMPLLRRLFPGARLSRHERLCRDDIASARDLLARPGRVLICCRQEAPLFLELAEEVGRESPPRFVNIRESAGWSAEAERAGPKMAALMAAALHEDAPAPLLEVSLRGRCLVAGPGQAALDLAAALADELLVSVLLAGEAEDALPPRQERFPLRKGRLARLTGHVGGFLARMEEVAEALPWAREGLAFGPPRKELEEEFDIVIELAAAPRFHPHGREGYFHSRPDEAAAIARIAGQASAMVGEFEKPVHARCQTARCAHRRNRIVGCSRCIDACPTSAIAEDGDAVRIDPLICEGCGDCAAVCPSGAIDYLFPRRDDLLARCNILLKTYHAAGGERPVLLFHETGQGEDLIAALARFGDGLPKHVLPVSLHSVSVLAHEIFAALAVAGAARIAIAVPRRKMAQLEPLREQISLFAALCAGLGLPSELTPALIGTDDPFELGDWLASLRVAPPIMRKPLAPLAAKREVARLALEALREAVAPSVEMLPLPAGAPYGAVEVDAKACTLCLSCVNACPAGALADNPERPQLRFVEAACLQCGLCRRTCPEGAITLSPRFDFTPAAREWRVLAQDEPMICPGCGKAFGSQRAVERVIARLAASGNPHFASHERLELLRYCEDCRVIAITLNEEDPFRRMRKNENGPAAMGREGEEP